MAALRCGVQTIEHGDDLDDEVIDLMLEKDIILVPTMWVTRQLMSMPDEMPDYAYRKLSELAEIQEEGLAKAIAAGVRIAMGTDIFVHGPLYGTNSLEIAHLVDAGHDAAQRDRGSHRYRPRDAGSPSTALRSTQRRLRLRCHRPRLQSP